MNKIVIITGTSSGLGRAFTQALLAAGFKVVGTVRRPKAALEFEQLKPGAAFARTLDVTESPERLASVVEEIEQTVGRCMRGSITPVTATRAHWKKAPWRSCVSSSR